MVLSGFKTLQQQTRRPALHCSFCLPLQSWQGRQGLNADMLCHAAALAQLSQAHPSSSQLWLWWLV